MDLGLRDKVVLVTAASKGLGKATALEFARERAKVAICARSDAIESVAKEIAQETGAHVLPFRADLTQATDIDNFVTAANREFGRIDILFINAGGPKPGTFLSLKPEDWETASNLTLMSAVRLCYAVVPHMLEQGVVLCRCPAHARTRRRQHHRRTILFSETSHRQPHPLQLPAHGCDRIDEVISERTRTQRHSRQFDQPRLDMDGTRRTTDG